MEILTNRRLARMIVQHFSFEDQDLREEWDETSTPFQNDQRRQLFFDMSEKIEEILNMVLSDYDVVPKPAEDLATRIQRVLTQNEMTALTSAVWVAKDTAVTNKINWTRWLKHDPDFKRKWGKILKDRIINLEKALFDGEPIDGSKTSPE